MSSAFALDIKYLKGITDSEMVCGEEWREEEDGVTPGRKILSILVMPKLP